MAKNRPRQNMSLGPNNGGFGSGNSNNNAGTLSGGNGGNNNNNGNRKPKRPHRGQNDDNPFLQVGVPGAPGASGSDPFAPVVQDGAGGVGSIFDDPTASQSSGGDNTYRDTAWGLFNQAGIDNDPVFGSQQTDFLNNQIENWYQRWRGEAQINGEDRVPFDRWLMNMTGGPAPGTTPDLNYVQTQWGPAMKQMLAGMYQSQSPRNRGTDMRQWVAPKRTIQF